MLHTQVQLPAPNQAAGRWGKRRGQSSQKSQRDHGHFTDTQEQNDQKGTYLVKTLTSTSGRRSVKLIGAQGENRGSHVHDSINNLLDDNTNTAL